MVIPIAILVGLRGRTPDTLIYYNIFKNIDSYNLLDFSDFYVSSGVEIGYGWYAWLVSVFTDNHFILFFIFSIMVFYFILKSSFIAGLKYLNVMAFYLPTGYFFMQQFMQIRQALAVPIAIYAALLLITNKKKLAFLFFILAASFHQSTLVLAIFSIFYYFFEKNYKIIYSPNMYRWLTFLIIIILFIMLQFFIKDLVVSRFERLESYAQTDEYGKSVGFFSFSNIRLYLILGALLLLTNDRLLKNKFYIFFSFLFVVGIGLRIALYDFAILSGRLSNVFLFVEIFLIPLLLTRFSISVRYIATFIYFIVMLFLTLYFQAGSYIFESYFIPLY